MPDTLIIAEAGVNHNGDEQLAHELVDAACDAGADVVKFQIFQAEHLVTANADLADYQKSSVQNNTGKNNATQFEMLKDLELSTASFKRLRNYCKQKDIGFMATAFDTQSLDFLTQELNVEMLKLPSGELTNSPFVYAHGKTGRDVIVSTGMANLAEVRDALFVLKMSQLPDEKNELLNPVAWSTSDKWDEIAFTQQVSLLHCISQYPAPFEQVNLRAMQTLAEEFGLPVGWSDHTKGIHIAVAAVAMGGSIVEKHFTLDNNMEGPDHKASLNADELKNMVQAIRQTERALGNGIKTMQPTEQQVATVVRRSLVAATDIAKGDIFGPQNLTCKRPGTGISPTMFWSYLGKTASQAYCKDQLINE